MRRRFARVLGRIQVLLVDHGEERSYARRALREKRLVQGSLEAFDDLWRLGPGEVKGVVAKPDAVAGVELRLLWRIDEAGSGRETKLLPSSFAPIPSTLAARKT